MTSAERQERINLLKKKALLVRSQLKSHETPEKLVEYHEILTEIERIQRIEDGFQSIMTFAMTYFRGDPPHDLLKADTPSPPFHYELCDHLRNAVLDPMMRRTAIAAPRSHAKSTIVTNIFPLWCVCYADDVKERYWVIIGDKQDNARKFLDVIKDEMEDNQQIIADFGKLKGDTWNALEIITANKVKISAHGAQEGLRGLRYGSFRPSVIMDDIESDDSCSTADRIEKMVSWFDRTVLPLGDPKHSKYFLVGTVIHYNSLLSQVMNKRAGDSRSGGWEVFKYRAICKWPSRMDLWNEWEEIYHSRLEGSDSTEAAKIAHDKAYEFYLDHQEEMCDAEVLWPERMDLLSLMTNRATKRLAFNSEYLNDPIDEDTRIFQNIVFYKPHEVNLDDCTYFGACDPSMGQTKRSDPSAIVTMARDKRGILYVVDVDVKRRHPDEIIQAIFRKARQFNYSGFLIETVAFQQFMRDELVRRSSEQGIYIPIREFKSTVRKEIRIASIEPFVTNGQIRFLPTQRDLIEQMEYFPKSAADDALDCCAMCFEIAKTAGSRATYGALGTTKPIPAIWR